MNRVEISDNIIACLDANPDQSISVDIGGVSAQLSIAIAHYDQQLLQYYGPNIIPDINSAITRSGIDCNSRHFGLNIAFSEPVILDLHDLEMNLLGSLKTLIQRFEVITIKNAALAQQYRDIGHRNRFPHLKFHRDRNASQPTPYSLYSRDPNCDIQCHPRASSTLFTTNLVAYLQCMKQRDYQQIITKGPQSHYDIFQHTDMSQVLGKILLEQRWDEPQGVGEISMIDNRTTLHASYLRHQQQSYRIGVRYLK